MNEEQPELYLILHKVRGEPAFDIAHKLQIGDEEGWIIPTSGHRAYPYDHILLDDLISNLYIKGIQQPPMDLPDHYAIHARPKIDLREIMNKILGPVASKIRKRTI